MKRIINIGIYKILKHFGYFLKIEALYIFNFHRSKKKS